MVQRHPVLYGSLSSHLAMGRGGWGSPSLSRAGVASRLQFSSAFMAGHLSASDECVLSLEMAIASARLWTLERLGTSVVLC